MRGVAVAARLEAVLTRERGDGRFKMSRARISSTRVNHRCKSSACSGLRLGQLRRPNGRGYSWPMYSGEPTIAALATSLLSPAFSAAVKLLRPAGSGARRRN